MIICVCCFFLMIRLPPRSTRTDTLFPYTTLFRSDAEARLIMGILNDAWSDNWGFVPLTDSEIAYVGKKLKTLVFEDLIRVAEVDGEPVAFMIVLPNTNELLIDMDGSLLPFGWARLLWWLRRPKSRTLRVPLMGVVKSLQNSRIDRTSTRLNSSH